jgi:hypothetical protein
VRTLTDSEGAERDRQRMQQGTAGAVGFLVGALVGGLAVHSMSEPPREAETQTIAEFLVSVDAGTDSGRDAAADAFVTVWTYRELPDEMRGTVRDIACTESTRPVRVGEPWGEARARLCVRAARYEDDPDVFVTMYGGVVDCGYRGCRIEARFDDLPVSSWQASESESREGVFVSDGGAFVRSMLDAREVIVEVPIAGRLPVHVPFAVHGLDWVRPTRQ